MISSNYLKLKLLILFILYVFNNVESYNLFGIPGLGYLIEIKLGLPPQKLNVLLDTGSSTLAVASVPSSRVTTYFEAGNSTSLYDRKSQVNAKYSQGAWWGTVASDYVEFPTLDSSANLRTDIVLITKDDDFFVKDSGYQGILGLAYSAISVGNLEIPWLDTVDIKYGDTKSFELTLCGVYSNVNVTHYGQFNLLDDNTNKGKDNKREFNTPILRERWFQIGLIAVHIDRGNSSLLHKDIKPNLLLTNIYEPIEESCQLLNKDKSIIDSGTTNIRLPMDIFNQVVDDLRNASASENLIILDRSFWYRGEAACWPQPQTFDLPDLAIDLLDAEDDHQYFTLHIPPQNYIRLVSGHNSRGTESAFCYKFGVEVANDTVLGVTAMEGFTILFNRSSAHISFKVSNCGPKVHISGPYKLNSSLLQLCRLKIYSHFNSVGSIKTAQWAAGISLSVTLILLIYILAPCIKNSNCLNTFRGHLIRRRRLRMSLSRATLVSLDT